MFTLIQIGAPCKWVNDSQRLLLEHFETIYNSPSQIYHSALPLCPSSSWLRKYYTAEFSQEVKVIRGLQTGWGACSRTVSFDSTPKTLVSWKDLVAIGLQSGDIIILDVATGSHTSVLSGHTSSVHSLVFSLDETYLVSGSEDKTVNLWDVQTGGVIKTFYGHTEWVLSVSISPDSAIIVSGSKDKTIHLWDIQTGECNCVIEQQAHVDYVRFSHTDSQYFTSVSGGKVQQWDINGHQIGPIYDGSHVAFSLDGTQFASCKEEAITIQDSHSGVVVAELYVAESDFYYCHFSPDGRLIAGATGSTIYLWDIASSNPHLIEMFIGHTSVITSLTFSSSLISASQNRLVKFWQITTTPMDPAVDYTSSSSLTSAPITSVTLQVKDGIAISSDSAGVVKTWDIITGLCRASSQTPAKGPLYKDAQLIDGRLLVIWHTKNKINIWDDKEDELKMIDMPESYPRGIRISGGGSKVFVLTQKYIQLWSIRTGEAVGKVELEKRSPYLDPLSVDGSRIWVGFEDLSTQGWDFEILDPSPIPLSSTSDRPHLDFVYGTRWHGAGPARIKDKVTGREIFQLSGRYADTRLVQWDSQYLVTGYGFGEVMILDFSQVFS